jgi:hypothetical protein
MPEIRLERDANVARLVIDHPEYPVDVALDPALVRALVSDTAASEV